jgi:hypothetical protein
MRDSLALLLRPKPSHPASRGYRGSVISMHRALAQFKLGTMNLLTGLGLFCFFSLIWFELLGPVCRFWRRLLGWALLQLPLHARLAEADYLFPSFALQVPYLAIQLVLPSPLIWCLTCGCTLLALALSSFFSQRMMPVAYLVRAILLVQASALLYFALWPSHFSHTPGSYMEGLTSAGLCLISIVPFLFACTYYIFDFGLWPKAFLTVLTMAHLVLFFPLQILVAALILERSVLFMPVLYIVFGMPLDVLLIIAFYSWGMTWSFRAKRKVH